MNSIRSLGYGFACAVSFFVLAFVMLLSCISLAIRLEDGTRIGGEDGFAIITAIVYLLVWKFQRKRRREAFNTGSIIAITLNALILSIPSFFMIAVIFFAKPIDPILASLSMAIHWGLLLFLVVTPLEHFILCIAKCIQVVVSKEKSALQP